MYNLPEMRADNARFGEALRELLRAHDWGLITVEFSEREDGIWFGNPPLIVAFPIFRGKHLCAVGVQFAARRASRLSVVSPSWSVGQDRE